ncbi:MAG: hypothetical protein HPY79_10365 [Bacteroidales bacterium]|nr:hypothetical protein [Bacteroidales bacterium]
MEKQHLNRIKEVFKTYPQEDKIILVSDGHVFLMNAQSLAIDHARRNGLEYKIIHRNEISSEKDEEQTEKKTKK